MPLDKVQMPPGTPLDLAMRSLKKYSSSVGVQRYFCERCGATVFVAKDKQNWIDIAAGLLSAEEGVWNKVRLPREATDQNLVTILANGINA